MSECEYCSFIANLKKINSPRETSEISNALREENKSSDAKKQDGGKVSDVQAPHLCTVLVWENVIGKVNVSSDYVEKMNAFLRGNTCVMSNCLRRLMKLGRSSVVELCTSEVSFKIAPVTIDVFPLVPVEDSKPSLITENVKTMLMNLTDEHAVILINPNSLMEVNIGGKNIDVLITTRDGEPLKLTNTSVVLLEVTLLKQHSNIPHILSTLAHLDKSFQAKFSYVGDQSVFFKLKEHVLIEQGFLSAHSDTVPQFALLSGSKGAGKTSLVESLMAHLSGPPYFIQSDIVRFKQLKGKKMETVEKKLQLIFKEAIFRRPSLIVLDDVDHLCPSQGSLDQDSGPAYEHTMQMVTMLKGLFDQVLEFFGDTECPFYSESQSLGSVMVIATCATRTSVHPLLVNPQGCHYFPCTFSIPPLEVEVRLTALTTMLKSHVTTYKLRTRSPSEHHSESSPPDLLSLRYLQADVKMISQRTESFMLPDLNHLALRIFLQAKQRWECREKEPRPNEVTERCSGSQGRSTRKTKARVGLGGDEVARWCRPRDDDGEADSSRQEAILSCDVEDALEGYTPLALRGESSVYFFSYIAPLD